MKIRVGIAGYGNVGRGVETVLRQNPDMELAAVFSRRGNLTIDTPNVPVYTFDDAAKHADEIDALVLCGGSAKDLPEHGPMFAELFNIVDSFDTHAKIPEYFDAVNKAALKGGKTAVISAGWDPGLFSVMRLLGEVILPEGNGHSFWGHGVSQGHSEAVRRIAGVKDAVQYTVPMEKAVEAARKGAKKLSTGEKHTRECFVVAEEGADKARIEREIKEMPHYFSDYQTTVRFISLEELKRNHSAMPHAGLVIRNGVTNGASVNENKHLMDFSLKLDSNPEFTACVLVAYARAAARLAREGHFGAKTVFDVPLSYLSHKSGADLARELL